MRREREKEGEREREGNLSIFSHLVYSTAPQEVVDPLIYEGFVEELVEVLEIRDSSDELVVQTIIVHVQACTPNGNTVLLSMLSL